jgi:hypothetical protein
MWFACPVRVIPLQVRQSAPQPGNIASLTEDVEDHATEKWRMRTRQKVGTISVEDLAVMPDLVQEVVRHVLGESCPMVPEKPNVIK